MIAGRQPGNIWEQRSDLIRCSKVSRKTQHSECEMAFDSRFDSGFANVCESRRCREGRREERKKAERDGERRRKKARERCAEDRKEKRKKCE